MQKVAKLGITFVLFNATSIYAAPEWKLPFPSGEEWQMTRGYNQSTHKDYGGSTSDDRYALDFAQNGCLSWRKPILAASGGRIISTGYSNSYGNYVLIDHYDDYISRYAHLDSVSVSENQLVVPGQEVGRAGNTGSVSGSSCISHPGLHLHFVIYHNGVGYKPEPMDGYTDFVVGGRYTSTNSPKVEQAAPPKADVSDIELCYDLPQPEEQLSGWARF